MVHRRRVLLVLCCVVGLVTATAAATTAFDRGQQLFLQDNPTAARPLLEEALGAEPRNELIYLYLGIVYEQLAQHERAITVMQRGLQIASDLRDELYFNIGNNFFVRGEFRLAVEMYGQAIVSDPTLVSAYLNRANARLQLEQYDPALADYTLYLQLDPSSSQRTQIEQIIALLQRREQVREQQELAEQERQNALMNAVLDSLKNAGRNTKNLSAGSAEAEAEYDELDLAD